MPELVASGQTGAMEALASDYDLLRSQAVGVWLGRDVVSVSGPAAVAFLQGQCSQDVAQLAVGASTWSWVLQPQGKVEALVRITRLGDDRLVLDTDQGWGEALAARLNRFKLRTKADIVALDWKCLAVRGPGAAEVARGFPAADDVFLLDADWPGLSGVDLVGAEVVAPPDLPLIDGATYELARIEAGFPAMGRELTDKTIPAESGIIGRTVSFTKGCYTGQELVARIDSRGGNVPRHLRSMVLNGAAPAGATVSVGGKAVGRLTSVAPRPGHGAVALAYVGRDVTPPADAEITWEDGATEGRIELLPLLS